MHGLDLAEPQDNATLSALRVALLDWKVLFFRDQDITTEQHLAFAGHFGELEVHPSPSGAALAAECGRPMNTQASR